VREIVKAIIEALDLGDLALEIVAAALDPWHLGARGPRQPDRGESVGKWPH
jgi:hypothetical protein